MWNIPTTLVTFTTAKIFLLGLKMWIVFSARANACHQRMRLRSRRSRQQGVHPKNRHARRDSALLLLHEVVLQHGPPAKPFLLQANCCCYTNYFSVKLPRVTTIADLPPTRRVFCFAHTIGSPVTKPNRHRSILSTRIRWEKIIVSLILIVPT